MANELGSHCSYCGTEYHLGVTSWPKTCGKCGNITYRNPTPVCVALIRVADGVLGVRRGIMPEKGELALPGGFHNFGETWQAGLVREVQEEVELVIHDEGVRLFDALTSPDGRHHLTFGTVNESFVLLPHFTPNDEVLETVILRKGAKLAFPLHQQAFDKYLLHLEQHGTNHRLDA